MQHGTRKPSNTRRITGICGTRSTGISLRFALYSAKMLGAEHRAGPVEGRRQVVGLSVRTRLSRSRKMPKTAWVGWPAGPVISGNRVEDLEDQGKGVEDIKRGACRHRC